MPVAPCSSASSEDRACNHRVPDEIQRRLNRIAAQAEQSSLIDSRKGDEACWADREIHVSIDVMPRCLIDDESESQ